jgi:hydrocephalus-inducing protein
MDRKNYCSLIEKAIETYAKPEKTPSNNIESKLFDKIYLTSWLCDFGNVIVGTTQKKVLKFKNIGDQQIEMFFDLKPIKGTEYNISPDKSKLSPGEEAAIIVTLATKKNSKFGKFKSSVVLDVKNGAKYRLELISNLTIPDISVDGLSEGIVDFGKVLCGQRKTVTLRFLNLKEIPCDWSLVLRDPIIGHDKDN